MFRQNAVHFSSWHEKTLESIQRIRFEQSVSQLPQLGENRIEALSYPALLKRLERCWQNVERKPIRIQQLNLVRESVLSSIREHADCLSCGEHELVERALILGGRASIEDAEELDAAKALSLRLWADIGLVSGQPVIELDREVAQHVERVFSAEAHNVIRSEFRVFHARMHALLYQMGVLDDRIPQKMILDEILKKDYRSEMRAQLARWHLWAGFDCIDYTDGVLLVHPALADPESMLANARRRTCFQASMSQKIMDTAWMFPEETVIQQRLEHTLADVLRDGKRVTDVVMSLRYLCKQGAPFHVIKEELQQSLIVCVNKSMIQALYDMFVSTPKWIECSETALLQ